jgi:exopolysaccharide biosynthesis WecB/TagA/CpsF family protein
MVVGNVLVDLIDRDTAMSLMLDSVSAPRALAVVSANLDHVHHFAGDAAWAQRTGATNPTGGAQGLRWVTLLDGVPLVRKANALTGRDWPKLSGSDLIVQVLEAASERGLRVGFLGGDADTHEALREVLAQRYPTITVAGTWSPSRAEVDDPAASRRIAADIRDTATDVLVVCMGKPRQEDWIARFGADTGAHTLLAFGAVVDFLAGRVRRAPGLIADLGGEWAWRLMLEPKRLGRRYLLHGPPSLVTVMRKAEIVQADAGRDR